MELRGGGGGPTKGLGDSLGETRENLDPWGGKQKEMGWKLSKVAHEKEKGCTFLRNRNCWNEGGQLDPFDWGAVKNLREFPIVGWKICDERKSRPD